jgi:hypothetical protein
MSEKIKYGGCLCGKIRYQIEGDPFASDYCHCRICQRQTGAPVSAWMDFKKEQIKLLDGNVKEFESSKNVRRGFCENCGSTLSFRDIMHPDYFSLSITSLDDPNTFSPNYHIYIDSAIKWHNIVDEYPKYQKNRT